MNFLASISILLVFAVLHSRVTASTSQCTLSPDRGPCNGAFTRYFWDVSRRQCRSFIWGGCQGSAGAYPFRTKAQCQNANCASTSNPSPLCSGLGVRGPCPYRYIRYFYDNTQKKCKPFIYGGCLGDAHFVTIAECQHTCL